MPSVAVTYLEMQDSDELSPKRCLDPNFRILECTVPQWQFNRFLYWTVGESWEWSDKRGWSESRWRAHAESPDIRTFAAYIDGSPAGYYELRSTVEPLEVEILYFGLMPAFIGRGLGGALLTSALEQAWAMQPQRVWVHTCTRDHPMAIANYQARGMRIYKVEPADFQAMPEEAGVAGEGDSRPGAD